MVLDEEFQKKITSLIEEYLNPHGIETHECGKKFWNYRSDDDFKYGHKAGVVLGMILGYYVAKYGKVPTDEDLTEMTEMAESQRDDIKKSFSDIHFSYKV